jgi:hypothetical protein
MAWWIDRLTRIFDMSWIFAFHTILCFWASVSGEYIVEFICQLFIFCQVPSVHGCLDANLDKLNDAKAGSQTQADDIKAEISLKGGLKICFGGMRDPGYWSYPSCMSEIRLGSDIFSCTCRTSCPNNYNYGVEVDCSQDFAAFINPDLSPPSVILGKLPCIGLPEWVLQIWY